MSAAARCISRLKVTESIHVSAFVPNGKRRAKAMPLIVPLLNVEDSIKRSVVLQRKAMASYSTLAS
jgi:hypothetical protein